jgi:hypothetical protein
MQRFLRRYWGYLALVLAILGLITHLHEYAVILILSLLAMVYFLVQAPLWCGAEIRGGGSCRNNSHGIILGCYLREHKWQRLKDIFISRRWRKTIHELMSSPKEILATIGGLASIVSLAIALVAELSH